MEQLGSHWMDFHEILYIYIYKKFLKKILTIFQEKSANNWYFM